MTLGDVLVGIDETPESLVAAAQANVLRAPGSRLVLFAIAERHLAAHAGMAAAHAEDALFADTSRALDRAKELVDADDAVLATGDMVRLLCTECTRRGAALIAVGARPHRRLPALTFGGHDVEALHDARCPVLVARPGWGPTKPERIVVGVDGSPAAHAAEVTARALAARLGCAVLPVVPLGDDIDAAVLRAEREDALLDLGGLVDAVARASTRGSLVVVGRPEERAHRWSASLVDRLAYSARCSVLAIRPQPGATA